MEMLRLTQRKSWTNGDWRCYFEDVLNADNPNVLEDTPAIHRPVEDISMHEVVLALRGLKSGKAAGSSKVTFEMFSLAGVTGTDILLYVFRNILCTTTRPLGNGLKVSHYL